MYVMNDVDKKASAELFDFLKKESSTAMEELYKESASYYTDVVLDEGKKFLSDVESYGRQGDFFNANTALNEYLTIMGRRYSNFDDLKVEDVYRKGDPHYIGQVMLRERRAGYILHSYIKGADIPADEICEKYGLNVMLCGQNSLSNIKKHIHPFGGFSFNVERAYRVRNEAKDKIFYDFMQTEGYTDDNILYLYNATVNPALLGVICDGFRIEQGNTGLLFGAGAYLSSHASKTAGYTSLSGSRWRNGTSDKGYICLYKVLSKNPLHLDGKSTMRPKKYTRSSLQPYDMLWAHKGYLMGKNRPLKAGEQVIFDERQLTLMYVIEITKP